MKNPELCLMGSEKGKNGINGPCWDNYTYVGPKVGKKGSCISKKNLCKKNTIRAKGYSCKVKLVKNGKLNCEKTKTKMKTKTKTKTKTKKKVLNKDKYNKCLLIAKNRVKKGEINLCPRGYCTAKHTFEVYPSAYANGYATSVCKGKKSDAIGNIKSDNSYIDRLNKKQNRIKKTNNLKRWYDEKWVNLCKKGTGPGGFDICGSGKGVNNLKEYPYCRAYYKLPGTKVVTVEELKQNLSKLEFNNLIKTMCKKKKSLQQGINGKPTRIRLPKWVYEKIKKNRLLKGGCWNIIGNKLFFY